MKLHVSTGKYKNTVLQVPKSARPIKNVVKQAIFSTLTNYNVVENAKVLDLYAGSGALGIECLSNNAKHVTFVEQDNYACYQINTNIVKLNLQNKALVENTDALKFIGNTTADYTLVFADPPYSEHHKHLLKTIHLTLAKNGLFVFAHSKNEPFLQAEDLELIQTRNYGQSSFSLYKA